jgi:hypothetical protein
METEKIKIWIRLAKAIHAYIEARELVKNGNRQKTPEEKKNPDTMRQRASFALCPHS